MKKKKILILIISIVVISLTLGILSVFFYEKYTKQIMAKKIEKQILEFEKQVQEDGFENVLSYKKFINDTKKSIKTNSKLELEKIGQDIEKISSSEKLTKKQYDELVINLKEFNDIIKKNNFKLKKLMDYHDSAQKTIDELLINEFEKENKKVLDYIKLADSLVKCNKDIDDNIEKWKDKTELYSYYDTTLKKQLDKKISLYKDYFKICDIQKATEIINEIKKMAEKWDEKYEQRMLLQQEANMAFADYLEKEYLQEEQIEDEDDYSYNDSSRYLYDMIDIDNNGVDELIYINAELTENDDLYITSVTAYFYVNGKIKSLILDNNIMECNSMYFNFKEAKIIDICGMDHCLDIRNYDIQNGEMVEKNNGRLEYISDWMTSEGDAYYLDGIEISKDKYDQEFTKVKKNIEENYISLFPDFYTNKKENMVSSALKKYKQGIELGNYNNIRYTFGKSVNMVSEYDFGEENKTDAEILDGDYLIYNNREGFNEYKYNTDINDDGNDEDVEITNLYNNLIINEKIHKYYIGIKINDKNYYKLSFNANCEAMQHKFIQLASGVKVLLFYGWSSSDCASDYHIVVFNDNIPYILNTNILDNIENRTEYYVINNSVILIYDADTNEVGKFPYMKLLKFKGKNISLSNEGYFGEIDDENTTIDNLTITYTSKKEFYIYKDKKCKMKLCKIKKNTKVEFLKCVFNKKGDVTAIKLKTGGITGWLKVSNHLDSGGDIHAKELFKECADYS